MKRFKLNGPYKAYDNAELWGDNSGIQCVVDGHILGNQETDPNKQVMLLIEPRTILPTVYEFAPSVANRYKYVFTHDSELLKTIPNAKPIIWCSVWVRCENPDKTKLISIMSSDKEACELHIARKNLAKKYMDKIDAYGTFNGGVYVDTMLSLEHYMYSVAIENQIDDIWFSEKILNCFATKTIPVYLGARDIDKYFNKDGIIICHDIDEVEMYINYIVDHPDKAKEMYNERKEAIEENFEISKKYASFEKLFYDTYKNEIEEMFK